MWLWLCVWLCVCARARAAADTTSLLAWQPIVGTFSDLYKTGRLFPYNSGSFAPSLQLATELLRGTEYDPAVIVARNAMLVFRTGDIVSSFLYDEYVSPPALWLPGLL